MKAEYRDLRLKQLTTALAAFDKAKQTPRPQRGWLHAIRQALGMSRQQVAKAMRVTQQSITDFERAEANDRITLGSLRRVAEAMGCKLVYAIVPKSGTIVDLAEKQARDEANKRVRSVEHTMALEDQAPGNVDEAIAEETKRILTRKR